MKNQVQNENEIREYLMFSEFEMRDVDYDVTFDIVDIDFWYETVTVAITDNGKIMNIRKQLSFRQIFKLFWHSAAAQHNRLSALRNIGAYP